MGAFLEKPKTEKTTEEGEAHGLKYCVSAMQGWRMEMEDAHVCNTKLSMPECSFFGVFDGHAGSKVSTFCSENLLECISESLEKGKEFEVEYVKKAMYKGFLRLDEKLKEDPLWATGQDHSGSTSIVVLVSPTHIIWANCGDSRSVFCRKNAVAFATTDHKPSNETEKTRIEKAGGTVMMQRVNGTLAVSRALGDFDYKRDSSRKPIEQLVSPEPDIHVMERNKQTDEFLILACDGIYDVMTNEEVITYVRRKLELTDDLCSVCNDLIDHCLNKNSRDNMSVILVTFPGAPKVSEEAIEREKELQKEAQEKISERLQSMVQSSHDPLEVEENYVIQTLVAEFPHEYDVPGKKTSIIEELQILVKEKFGSFQELSGPSDPSDAPVEMQIETSSGTQFIQAIMTSREDDNEQLDAFDEQLVGLGDEKMDTHEEDEQAEDGSNSSSSTENSSKENSSSSSSTVAS